MDEKKLRITMDKYLEDVLRLYELTGYAKTPAAVDLLSIDEKSPQLVEERADLFHSRMAKVLYFAKKVQSEVLPVVIFLITRVNGSTEHD
jgi:hypothetical protein